MRPQHISERHQPLGDTILVVRLPDGTALGLRRPFLIGRDFECEIQVQDAHVSRRHAQVSLDRGQWFIRDLQSSNGLYVEGQLVESAPIGDGIRVRLGADGPLLVIGPAGALSVEEAGGDEETGGERTQFFHKALRTQQRKYRWMIGAVASVALAAVGYAYYTHTLLEKWAENKFYEMKATDVLIAAGEEQVEQTGDTKTAALVKQYMQQRREMETNYEQYFRKLYDRNLSPQDQLILKVTRIFGECELAAPPDYIKEVSRFIAMWQSTSRYEAALKRAREGGYMQRIVTSFAARNLPPQYFYLALQESNFVTNAVGSPTRWGIARGMWQFIPETGRRYGLIIAGNQDERLDWERATTAAARYIKDIYATDAEASGLLVMASYNWGEHRVIDIVRTLPKNPKERNFWQLLAKRKIPEQTYNYVFSIVSAAVIGENPRLFNFDFDNPLASATQPARSVLTAPAGTRTSR
jgi:pSer/pThr/pTyr-binding forkhead associated (FHA) protein/soluble lytic murein transglycosylase-like protein